MNDYAKVLQPYVYQVVCKLHREREVAGKFPYIATLNEIKGIVFTVIEKALNELVSDGLLRQTENVNRQIMYEPTKNLNIK